MKPSKLEWMLAVVLFLLIFASWNFGDTQVIVGHQIDFADSLLHGEIMNFYQRTYDHAMYDKTHGLGERGASSYDLVVNFVFGLWGIPNYLLGNSTQGGGGIRFAHSFWKILYGKSLFFFAFVICAILVYKICRELELSENKSRWASFIYFTSSMAVNSVCLVGNCDSLGAALTLAGILAYIRQRDRESFLWFVLAFPFKQQCAFIFLPLMLMRDKNLFRVGFKLFVMAAFVAVTDLPMRTNPEAFAVKNEFFKIMLKRILGEKLPFLSSNVSIFTVLYGLLCSWCWLTPEPESRHDRNTATLFVSMLSIAIALSLITSHPQWFLQLVPYLAISIVYYGKTTKELFIFETVGSLGLLGYNFGVYYWVYSPNNAARILLDKFVASPGISLKESRALLNQSFLWKFFAKAAGKAHSATAGIYAVCMIVIIFWLCRPQNADTRTEFNFRPYAIGRMVLNMAACAIPLALFFLSAISL